MKSLILALSVAVFAAGFVPSGAEAKRFGGGSSAGLQRSLPARPVPPARPAEAAPATPAAPTAAATPAAPPKRSWLGPIAGLAAGLGIAALMSHLGLGAAMGNVLLLVLLAVAALAAVRFVMARMGRGAPAMAIPNTTAGPVGPIWNSTPPPALVPAPAVACALPAGFDAAGFERLAKMIFIRMQAANDSADLNDLRSFTTPEMFANVRLALQERGNAPQTTDVVQVDADMLDVSTEAERQLVSVRFHGLIREDVGGVAAPFDEVWHLVRPLDGSREWAIAGIQQAATAG